MTAANVEILVGPARSGKTGRLLEEYRGALERMSPGSTLWLSPTHRSCQEVRKELIASGVSAVLGPGVMTFEQLAESVIAASPTPVRGVSRVQKRHILRRLVASHLARDQLEHFGPIAKTSGFIDLLAEFISELKRLEVWPEELAKSFSQIGHSPKSNELLSLYETYQDLLNKSNLYDAEGRFWSARSMLRVEQRRPFDRLRLVIADGFTDFTRTQHEILEILSERVERLLVSLPIDTELASDEAESKQSSRSQLFRKSIATLRQFQNRHQHLKIQTVERHETWPALSHIERHLFSNPREAADAVDTAGIDVLAAGGHLSELRHVGRRIKRLLLDGDPELGGQPVSPEDIVVVFRSLGDRSSLVREVFQELGLPAHLEGPRRLGDSKLIAAVVLLLRLDAEGWPFNKLLAVLSNDYLLPKEPESTIDTLAAERVIRHAQIPGGRDALLNWLKNRIDREAEAETHDSTISYADSWPWFAWLISTLDALPDRATPSQWARALDELVGTPNIDATDDRQIPEDASAWTRLKELLESLEVIDRHTVGHPETLTRSALLTLLSDLASNERIPEDSDETGSIRVLSAQSVRGLRVPYLFLVDLAEHVFPTSHGENRIYSEYEATELAKAGIALRNRAEHNCEEMLLFYEVITRVTRRLFMSYAAWTEKADPLLPSPYLADVRRACGQTPIKTIEVQDLSPIPDEETPYSESEWRVLGLSEALAGRPSLAASLASHPGTATVTRAMLAAVEMCRTRNRGDSFAGYEGMLGPAASEQLSVTKGPHHVWSAAELELYAICPFKFFSERVLKLQSLDVLELETDFGRRGSVAHDVLAAVHRRLLEEPQVARSLSTLSADEFAAMLQEELARLLDVAEADRTVGGAMRVIDRRRLTSDLGGYVDSHQEYDAKWSGFSNPPAPKHFEVSFGLDAAPEDPLSTTNPLVLHVQNESIKVGGRIDRIDLGEVAGELVFNVLDYKTGQIPGAKFQTLKNKDALQLPLYVLATEEVLLGTQSAVAFAAGYWALSRTGKTEFKHAIGLAALEDGILRKTEQYTQLREWLSERVWSLVHGVRGGQFPMFNRDENCTSTCDFNTICRVNQTRSMEKTWQPPTASTT